MRVVKVVAIFVSALMFLLSGCGDSPTPTTEKKAEAVKPPEPITGLTGLYRMYAMARQWAPDAQVLRARSIRISEVKSEGGKSGAWEATFVSESGRASRTYTVSVVEAEGNLHEGVFAGQQAGYSGATAQVRPFPINVARVDSEKAFETAMSKGADYAKKHPDTPISFLLELAPGQTNPTWRVIWGDSVATSAYSVLVDAATGEVVQILR